MADYERLGRFIYGFHPWASPDALRALPGSGEVGPALAERGAALAARFDAVSDERIALLLDDVRTFAAELDYARNA